MSKKQTIILIVVFSLTFIAFALSATFAWFSGVNIALESDNSKISSAKSQLITFNAGNPISIHADNTNFGEGMDSLLGETFCSVSLTAASNMQMVAYNYFVKINIEKNDFIYTIDHNRPELLLVITDPLGNPLKSLGNLKYVESEGYQGFDITQVTGTYDIAANYEIKTNDYAYHEWKAKIVFLNFPENQDANKNRSLKGKMEIGLVEELS